MGPQHPELLEKLSLLYRAKLNPNVGSHTALAQRLNISRQSISKWCRGTDTSLGDTIPDRQLTPVSELFGIPPHWFELPLTQFETEVSNRKAQVRDAKPRISVSQMPITDYEVFGREAEVAVLDESLADPSTNVLEIKAFGGSGKSALVNLWLRKLHKENYRGMASVYAWSFAWQGGHANTESSGDLFVDEALRWLGDSDSTAGTPWSRATRLANLLRESKSLLILDGLEALQSPPGPNTGQIDNPAVALLVRELAVRNNGLCVITTRLDVADLSPYLDERTRRLQLGPLTLAASRALLLSKGIGGTSARLDELGRRYVGHPLSLNLVAGFLSVMSGTTLETEGDLEAMFEERDLTDQVGRLMRLYLGWFDAKPELGLLRLLALIGRPVGADDLREMANRQSIPRLTGELQNLSGAKWNYMLKRLGDANLVGVDNNFVGCHPLVCQFVAGALADEDPETWKAGHRLIFEHLQAVAPSQPNTIADLEPLLSAVVHGCKAGLMQASYDVYVNRVKQGQFAMRAGGSHHADQACMRSFFDVAWTEPKAELPEDARFYLLTCASANLMYLGKIDESIGPTKKCIDWYVSKGKALEAVVTTGHLSSMLFVSGGLKDAIEMAERVRLLVEASDNQLLKAMSAVFEGYIAHLQNNQDLAGRLFRQSEPTLNLDHPPEGARFPTISSYYCNYLLEAGLLDEALQRVETTFNWRERQSWQTKFDTTSVVASDYLVMGRILLRMGETERAIECLEKQVEMFRSVEDWLYLPIGLAYRARGAIAIERYAEAEADISEALNVSQRTGARLAVRLAHITSALMHHLRGEADLCHASLEEAKAVPGLELYHAWDEGIAGFDKLKNEVFQQS